MVHPTKCTDSQLHQHIEPLQAGNRHIPSATLASPSMAPLTADVDPSAVLLQGRHDAAAGTSRSPAFPEAAFLVALKYVSVFTNQWTKRTLRKERILNVPGYALFSSIPSLRGGFFWTGFSQEVSADVRLTQVLFLSTIKR